MSSNLRTKSLSEKLLSWITVISLILGGLWAIVEYYERKKTSINDKISQVMVFVERYNRDPIQKYRDNKIKAFTDAYRTLYRETKKRNPTNQLDFQQKAVDSHPNLRFEIDNVTFFYDELYICAEAGICDCIVVHEFFGKHAYDFLWGLRSYIDFVKEVREYRNVTGYGEGLMHFANVYKERNSVDLNKLCKSIQE